MTLRDSVRLSEYSAYEVLATMLVSIILIFSFTGSVFADSNRTVNVSFEFKGDEFFMFLESDERDFISKTIADKFISVASKTYPLFNWINAGPSDGETAWKIKLELIDLPNGVSGVLIYECTLPDGTTDKLHQVTLYEEGGFIPFLEAVTLESNISDQLDEELPTILNKTNVTDFLSRIAIVDDVTIDKDNRWVIIPVKWRDLHTDTHTKLLFKFREAGGQNADMTLNPWNIEMPDDYKHYGQVRGYVTQVRQSDIEDSNFEEGFWNEDFEKIISSAKEKKVYVDVAFYSPVKRAVEVEVSNGATSRIE